MIFRLPRLNLLKNLFKNRFCSINMSDKAQRVMLAEKHTEDIDPTGEYIRIIKKKKTAFPKFVILFISSLFILRLLDE